MKKNTVEATHAAFQLAQRKWERLRDSIAGYDAIIDRDAARFGRKASLAGIGMAPFYLPPVTGQTADDYYAYQRRGEWFGVTARTVDMLVGLIFAKPPEVDVPPVLEPYLADITLGGDTIRDFAKLVATEEISMGRVGVMVEFPNMDTSGMTVAQAEANNARPYLTAWKAEQIVDWRTGNVPQQGTRLTFVKLLESVAEYADDLAPAEMVQQYRILDLFNGVYRQRVYRANDKGEWMLIGEVIPTANGKPLPFIPFLVIGGPDIKKPMLLDLADTNIAHYRTGCDYGDALHTSARPTAWVAGVQLEAGQSLTIGTRQAWVFPNPDASCGFLEYQGQGLQPHAEKLSALQVQMAFLGAQTIGDSKGKSETATGAELRTAGERGTLGAVALDVSEAIRTALEWMAGYWLGASGAVRYELNTDYGLHNLDPTMFTALLQAYQSGAMPLPVFFQNLKRGGIAPATMTAEDYEAMLDTQPPATPAPAA